jgi:very-short-patch-repair endonuclease
MAAGIERDAYYPDEMLILELDGWQTHSTRTAFETDRERDAQALALGLATLRITHDRLHGAARAEADRLRRILDSRRGQAAGA